MFFVLFLLLFLQIRHFDWSAIIWRPMENCIPLKTGSGRFRPLASVVFQMALPPCFPVDGACCVYFSGCFLLLWTWCRSLYCKNRKSAFEFLGHVPSYHLLQQRNCKWGFHFQSSRLLARDEGYNLRHFWNNVFDIKLAMLAYFWGFPEPSTSGNPGFEGPTVHKTL